MATIDGVPVVMPALDGYVVDFDNPQRTGVRDVYFVAGFGGAISLLSFDQRMYVKLFLAGEVQLDDIDGLRHVWVYTMRVCCGSILYIEALIGLCRYDTYIAAFLYPICGSFAKLSLLVPGLRLPLLSDTIGINLPLIFACQPIQKSWDATITHGHCLNLPSLYIATAVANIVSDAILFNLPLPMMVEFHIPRRQKIGLVIIFGIG
ncbi:unnamed protein product [Clonostachys chloroleuca]|uniref:Rhodopsin domain-containing protein n=1 Tax=Clonostachys chloroleuca TaxID=1926264 RepID=A0AA35M821_9HYPO|nr:unnamed protein product [Clonostachys chloroleuca]